ncbi:MAG: hypothetical protein F4Y02_06605 [Chloroflexi bacterium]|nr:hypothetical protein [Chloroflexota bacterium]
MGFNIGKVFKHPGRTFKDFGHTVEGAVTHPDRIVKHPERILHMTGKAVEGVAEDVKDDVQKVVDAALEEALEEIAKGVLSQVLRLLDTAAPSSFSLAIGPVGLPFSDIRSRLADIRHYVSHPPTKKSEIKAMIVALAPDSVSITLNVSLALLVAQSDSLQIGATLTWETEEFIDNFVKLVS